MARAAGVPGGVRKLTFRQAEEIRAKHKGTVADHERLALEYGVTRQTIQKIVKGIIWNRDNPTYWKGSEKSLHKSVVEFVRAAIKPNVRFFHVPNESKAAPQYRKSLNEMGVSAGVPDLLFVLETGEVRWMELKNLSRGKLSNEQKEWHEFLNRTGQRCVVVYTLEEAIEILRMWGVVRENVNIAA